MKILIMTTSMLLLAPALQPAFAGGGGGTVEKGGRTIACLPVGTRLTHIGTPIPEDPVIIGYNMEYDSADYIRALSLGYQPADFTQYQSWDEGRDRMLKLLDKVSPALYATFKEFAESTKQIGQDHPSTGSVFRRAWLPARGKMELFGQYSWTVPQRCHISQSQKINVGGVDVKVETTAVVFFLTVTRRQDWKNVEYLYDPLYLSNLRGTSLLQYTFLLTHEWLWDHTNDLQANQDANAFLHSRQADHMTPEEIRDRLHKLGLNF